MAQYYSDPSRASDSYSLPDVEVFYRTLTANKADGWLDGDGEPMGEGWYWWSCFPGCMPEGDPMGPFDTEAEAVEDAQSQSEW